MTVIRNGPSGPLVVVGGGDVNSVQGSNGIIPATPQTGVVTLSGEPLLPRDGSRSLAGVVDCGGVGGLSNGSVNGVTLRTDGPNTQYLDRSGVYSTPAGGAVESVQGSNGIIPATPQTGVVTLSGEPLLPRDGSRSLTGVVDCGGVGGLSNGSVNGVTLRTDGPNTQYLDRSGGYSTPVAGATPMACQVVGREFNSAGALGSHVIHLSRFVAPKSMSVTALGFIITSPSGSDTVLFGLYSSDLTSLLGDGSFTPDTAGWTSHALSAPVSIVAGTEYWVAYKQVDNSSTVGHYTALDANQNQRRNLYNAGASLPADVSGATPTDKAVSAYIYGSA